MRPLLVALIATILVLPAGDADEPKADGHEPLATIVVGAGRSTATPFRQGSARTGGGNLIVTQPAPDTLSVTMTGAAAAKGHPLTDSVATFACELSQGFEVVVHAPMVHGPRLVMWGRTIGLLRSDDRHCNAGGAAEASPAGHASVQCGADEILALDLPPRAVASGENLSIHDREGPVWIRIGPGKYTLHQAFGIRASHAKGLFGKPASAEFAPDPALEADWLGHRDPLHGVNKKDFGFQVILKVICDDEINSQNDKRGNPRATVGELPPP